MTMVMKGTKICPWKVLKIIEMKEGWIRIVKADTQLHTPITRPIVAKPNVCTSQQQTRQPGLVRLPICKQRHTQRNKHSTHRHREREGVCRCLGVAY